MSISIFSATFLHEQVPLVRLETPELPQSLAVRPAGVLPILCFESLDRILLEILGRGDGKA